MSVHTVFVYGCKEMQTPFFSTVVVNRNCSVYFYDAEKCLSRVPLGRK